MSSCAEFHVTYYMYCIYVHIHKEYQHQLQNPTMDRL